LQYEPIKILVGFDNGIGNFIIFTQALQALYKHFQTPVYFMVSGAWNSGIRDSIVELASQCYFIEEVLEYPKDYQLKKWDYKFMSFHSNFIDPMFTAFHGSNFDWEKAESWGVSFLAESTYYHCELVDRFGINIWPKQFCPYDDEHRFMEYLNPGYIAISNSYLRTNQGELDRKQYAHWNEVIKTIHCLYDERDIVLLGGDDDREWAQEIQDNHPYIFDFTGETSILETAGIIKHAAAILSTDTGCYHIADALGTPGIVLFGATLVSKNGPLNNNLKIIRSPLSCAPCQGTMLWEMCQSRTTCMDYIDPGLVIATLRNIISV
jgi:ADP-heptose:LPS heptosyltransferase